MSVNISCAHAPLFPVFPDIAAWARLLPHLQLVLDMLFVSLTFALGITSVMAFETSFTFRLEPGTEECFFQNVPKDSITEIEYQV